MQNVLIPVGQAIGSGLFLKKARLKKQFSSKRQPKVFILLFIISSNNIQSNTRAGFQKLRAGSV